MSTKYTNMSVQVVHRPYQAATEKTPEISECWDVVVGIVFTNAIPRIPGQPRPKRGHVYGQSFRFHDEAMARSTRNLIEHLFDTTLPIAMQHGVLVPVDDAEAAKTLVVPGVTP